jgi:hypothetical protein
MPVLNVSELNSFSGILAEPSKSRWPGCAQPLLRAARHFAPPDEHGHDFQRLFAATKFTHHRLAGAAANCGIELPDQQDRFTYRILTLRSAWLSQVTCTHTRFMGGDFDRQFLRDQAFTPSPTQVKILERAEQARPPGKTSRFGAWLAGP